MLPKNCHVCENDIIMCHKKAVPWNHQTLIESVELVHSVSRRFTYSLGEITTEKREIEKRFETNT